MASDHPCSICRGAWDAGPFCDPSEPCAACGYLPPCHAPAAAEAIEAEKRALRDQAAGVREMLRLVASDARAEAEALLARLESGGAWTLHDACGVLRALLARLDAAERVCEYARRVIRDRSSGQSHLHYDSLSMELRAWEARRE